MRAVDFHLLPVYTGSDKGKIGLQFHRGGAQGQDKARQGALRLLSSLIAHVQAVSKTKLGYNPIEVGSEDRMEPQVIYSVH